MLSCTPKSAPTATGRDRPPNSWWRGFPASFAVKTQNAVSSPAFAKGLPLTAATAARSSSALSISRPTICGARNASIRAKTPPAHSAEYVGAWRGVVSPQP